MKNIALRISILFILMSSSILNAQINKIELYSLPTGSEGNEVLSDISSISFDKNGNAYCEGDIKFLDWKMQGTTDLCMAIQYGFNLNIQPMSQVDNTQGANYGALIEGAGIDRDGSGLLGVRGRTNGIDAGEGILLGLDLSYFNSTISIELSEVILKYVNDNESGIIINRQSPEKFIRYSATTNEVVNDTMRVDVSTLGIKLQGEEVQDDLVSIFNDATEGNYRVLGLVFRINEQDAEGESYDYSQITGHPRLFLNDQDLQSLKQAISVSSEKQSIHNHIIRESDIALTLPPLEHKLDGKRLLDVSREALRRILYLSYSFRMTSDVKYLNAAKDVITTVCNFPDWNKDHYLDVAEMCMAVAIGYDWLYHHLDHATRMHAASAIVTKAFATSNNQWFYSATNNWNQVCNAGLVCGALAINETYKAGVAAIIDRSMKSNPLALEAYAPNGNYLEGAMYWQYGTTFQVMMISALEGVFGTDNGLQDYKGFMESAKFMNFMSGPTQQLFNHSDCNTYQSPKPIMYWFASKINDPSLIYEEERQLNMGAYFKSFGEDRILPLSLVFAKDINHEEIDKPTERIWVGKGITPVVLARTGWGGANEKYLAIKGGSGSTSHSHLDAGSFVYDANRYRWIMDLGMQSYDDVENAGVGFWDLAQDSERWDVFRLHNRNHSTMSINDQRHNVNGNAKFLEYYDADDKLGAKIDLTSTLNLNNELKLATRSVYIEDNSSLHINDKLSTKDKQVELYWNLVTPAAAVIVDSKTIRLTMGSERMLLKFSSDIPFSLTVSRKVNPDNSYEQKNTGITFVGFDAVVPADIEAEFNVSMIEDTPTSTTKPNYIYLDLHKPNTAPEGEKYSTDDCFLGVDKEGQAYITGFSSRYAWDVNGLIEKSTLSDFDFSYRYTAMAQHVEDEGPDYGQIAMLAGIDRASDGALGVRGNTNGIDKGEGFVLGFDLKSVPNNIRLRLAEVLVSQIGGKEAGVIVNRSNISLRKTFGASSTGSDVTLSSGSINVVDLDITINGGEVNHDLASVFANGGTGAFRIVGFRFKVEENSSADIDKPQTNNVQIWPNPIVDQAHIRLQTDNQAKVNVFDMTSRLRITSEINNEATIDFTGLEKGVYIISIETDKETIKQKIIKQ